MAETTFFVTLSPEQAAQAIENHIVDGSITGEVIDWYVLEAPSGRSCITAVFEKHYYRAGNRLTLTVVLDDFTGYTRVHAVGGGGGEGFFRFDWGASSSFSNAPREALAEYVLD